MSRQASVRAPAKVNLSLRVLRRRADGYHEIDTVFQAIDLSDQVEVELDGAGVDLDVGDTSLGPAEENLAYRAATAFLDASGADTGVRIRLRKEIPVGAGLGGGSTDAAAVLRCLAALIPGVDAPRLHEIGARLGSDVPFFLGGSALARGRGRGEVLEALPPLPPADLVLVSPLVHVSTAGAYRALAELRAGSAEPAASTDALVPARWDELAGLAVNDFEPLMVASHPEVRRALAGLTAAGASAARMTGSGSTCFGLFDGRDAAERAAETLRAETGWPCLAVRTLEALPLVRTRAGA